MTTVDHFTLTIPGKAHGQGRARTGQGRTYTPHKTRVHTALVQGEWIAAGRPVLADQPYVLHIVSYRTRPASHMLKDGSLSAVGRRAGCPGKPDCDNELKAIADSLVACGAIPDDRLCWDMAAMKLWVAPDVTEHVVVDAVTETPTAVTVVDEAAA